MRTEQIYNNMSKALYVFNKSLFNPLHQSCYNEIDLDLFKECRKINQDGEINRHCFQYNAHTNKDDKVYLHYVILAQAILAQGYRLKSKSLRSLSFCCSLGSFGASDLLRLAPTHIMSQAEKPSHFLPAVGRHTDVLEREGGERLTERKEGLVPVRKKIPLKMFSAR